MVCQQNIPTAKEYTNFQKELLNYLYTTHKNFIQNYTHIYYGFEDSGLSTVITCTY